MRKKLLFCGIIVLAIALLLLVATPFFVLAEINIFAADQIEKFELRQCQIVRGLLQKADDKPNGKCLFYYYYYYYYYYSIDD
jgi:hypothetical protein